MSDGGHPASFWRTGVSAAHGVRLDPPELIAAAHRAGRPAAERTTLYEIRQRHPIELGCIPDRGAAYQATPQH